MSEQAIEVFRCEQLNAWLRRETCGKQHREALRGLRVQRTGSAGVYGSPCVRCEIGKAHAKGLEPLVQVERLTAKASPAPPPKPPKKKRPAGVDHVSEVREAVHILQALDKRRSKREVLTEEQRKTRNRERRRATERAYRARKAEAKGKRFRPRGEDVEQRPDCGTCGATLAPSEIREHRDRCCYCRRLITHNGETKTITDWAKGTAVTPATIYARVVRKGWPMERALEAAPFEPKGTAVQAKLTAEQVQEVRERSARGESNRALAEAFGLSASTVSAIVRRTKWRFVA